MFRRQKQQLLKEKRYLSFLQYAAGEVVLVVIGILIAFSINRWNSNRKQEDKIIQTGKMMVEDLKADTSNAGLII